MKESTDSLKIYSYFMLHLRQFIGFANFVFTTIDDDARFCLMSTKNSIVCHRHFIGGAEDPLDYRISLFVEIFYSRDAGKHVIPFSIV